MMNRNIGVKRAQISLLFYTHTCVDHPTHHPYFCVSVAFFLNQLGGKWEELKREARMKQETKYVI